jgi:thioredoxin 2
MPDAQILRCAQCGTQNRVPLQKLQSGQVPICGRCKAALSLAASGPVTITDSNFAAEVESSALPVLLDMWAPWCGPCRMIAPDIEALAHDLAGRVRVGKMNIDENPATASRFNVRSIPALLILKQGREAGRIVGAQPKSEIVRQLERALE